MAVGKKISRRSRRLTQIKQKRVPQIAQIKYGCYVEPMVDEMNENELSYLIRGAIFNVYNALGPGLLESAYETVLAHELINEGLNIKRQLALPLIYNQVQLDAGYRIDIMVEDRVIIEIKSVETLMDVHHKQIITYLKLSGKKLGILVNFNCDDINKSIFRKVNNL